LHQTTFYRLANQLRTAPQQDETGNPAFKPVSLFYCSALVWNIFMHYCPFCPSSVLAGFESTADTSASKSPLKIREKKGHNPARKR